MIYLDPRSDMVFKKLFGDITHKNILISFLNSVLGRVEGKKIIDVVINDPSNVPETPLSKTSIVDVRCTDQSSNQYIVEMQVVTQKDYGARAQYYSSLALSRQLASGESYSKLVPVIFVGVLDFSLFKTSNYISHHFILDNETHEHELAHMEFHFIELPKFNKKPEALNGILEKWIYFIKNAGLLQKVPSYLSEPVLTEAFGVLAQSNWSIPELEAYDRYQDSIRSAIGQLEAAMEKGMEKGIEKARLEMAKKLLSKLDIAAVAEITGLSVEELTKLKK